MPNRCVVWGCSNTSDASKNISLHKIPFEADSRPEAKKRRRQWIKFVSTKRARWTPTTNSCVCSIHFNPDDFTRRFNLTSNSDSGETLSFMPRLVSDEVGVLPVPSVSAEEASNDEPMSSRSRRLIIKNILQEKNEEVMKKGVEENPKVEGKVKGGRVKQNSSFSTTNYKEKEEEVASCNCSIEDEEYHENDLGVGHNGVNRGVQIEVLTFERTTQTPDCYGCKNLANRNRILRNKIIDLQRRVSEKKEVIKKLEKEKRQMEKSQKK